MPELHSSTPEQPVLGRRQLKRLAIGGAVAAAVIIVAGTAVRLLDRSQLASRTEAQNMLTVGVVHPIADPAGRTLALPGTIEAWSLAPVYARTSGYLQKWYADIGAKVKEGELLAEIDTPELDQQLAVAQAQLGTAEANRALSATTAERWKRLVERDAVSRQEADEKSADFAARSAMANAARAEVDRLKALSGFKRIVAPFAGTVTSRATDIGALIGPANSGTALFTVAAMHKMRIYVRVPQSYAGSISPGLTATVKVPEYPDRTFTAELARTADAVNIQTGTILTQLVVDNPQGALKSGAYADVTFKLPGRASVVRVPASVLIFRKEGMMVATVDSQGIVALKPVVIAQDLGANVDIGDGLTAADVVIDNPTESLENGDQVRVLDPSAEKAAARDMSKPAGNVRE